METNQYLDVFIDESVEHLETMSDNLLELEKNPEEKSIIEGIFRAAHTIKGMSATMGYQDLADLTHNLENVFDGIRYDKIKVEPDMMDVLFDTLDQLNAMVEDISSGGDSKRDVSTQIKKLASIEKGEPFTDVTSNNGENDAEQADVGNLSLDEFELAILNESAERGFNNFEVEVQLSEKCLLKGARVFMVFEVLEQMGEVIKSNPPVSELEEENFDYSFNVIFVTQQSEDEVVQKIKKVSEVSEVNVKEIAQGNYEDYQEKDSADVEQQAIQEQTRSEQAPTQQSNDTNQARRKTIRVNIDRLDVLMNLFEELVIDRGRLEQISTDLNNVDLTETVERMSRVSGDLQDIILNMRMVPIDSVFNRFPRMIRQLARELDKEIGIDIIGADTELDRTVIDEIGDPLVHLIRNAIDHGIESPADRVTKGKPSKGTITLKAYQGGNYVFIEISDDGAGINRERVLNKALENNVVTSEEAKHLTDQEVYELILESGFSTADSISGVSGRGVGLDVVKNTIQKLGGNITIDATPDKGSIFSIQLPLTLSIISALLVEIKDEKFAIPLASIIETVILHKDDILSAHNK